MVLVTTHPGAQQESAEFSTSTIQLAPSPSLSTIINRPPGTFHLFNSLPPELRAKIIREAMVTPGIYYFQLAPKHFLPSSRPLHPHIRQTCNSIWRQHLALARTSPEFAHVVNLAHTQSKNKRYIDAHKKYPFNVHDDLVVFSLGPAHGHDWMSLHVEAPADLIYNRFGHGLKRVGTKYEEDKHICARAHEAGGEWGLDSHTNIVGECWGPCWASTFRYISFFRDAELVYLMVYLTENQIHYNLTAWRVASKLQRIQKEIGLDKWQDSAHT